MRAKQKPSDDEQEDHIDRMLGIWAREIPGLDRLTEGIVERTEMLARYFNHSMEATLTEFGLDRRTHRVLGRLKENKYLDDERYARQFVRQRAEIRKQGSFRIARELRARGVPDRHIEAALAERAAESDEGATVRARLARRLKTLRGPLDERRTASLYNSLLRAGFAAETIRRELRAMAKVSVDESPETNFEDI